MTDQALDKLMRQVLIDSLAMDADGLEQVDFTPSKRHQQQMQMMLKNPLGWYKRKTKPVWKLALQRVAIVFLVVSIGFGSVMVVSPTARAAVIRWVVEWYETHIVYRYSGDALSSELPLYGITALPEGYSENVGKRFVSGPMVGIHYENDAGDMINLDYVYMQDGAFSLVEPDEGDVVSDVTVNGLWGQIFMPNDPNAVTLITWIDEDANLSFSIHAWCGEEEILAMAESVAPMEEKDQTPQYEITALPEGYAENIEQRIDNGATVSLWYENKHGDVILLNYTYMQEGAVLLTAPDDGDRVSEILVNGCLGHIYVPDDPENFTVITWIDEPKNALFSIHALYEEQELLAMAESVALVKEKKQMPQYEIARIPDGFIESDRIENSSSVSLFYEDGNGGVICFDYVYMHQGAATLITVDDNITDITVNGVPGQLFLPTETKGTTTVTWIDADANIQFVIDTSLNQDNAIALAESVFSVEKKNLMPQYEIGALPDGYRETDYVVLPANVSAAYENAAGDMICFDYVYMAQGAAWQFETEGAELLDVTVNGCKGQLLVPDDPANWTTLTWIDPKQNLQFCIDAVGDKDSVIRLAESIVLKDTSKGGNK